ncbi:Tim10/DDP family zinc finger-domain-containing protein [Cladochytrium replicatum]|nr:Tim10/DDP family zinc finger-domain-containing protein [Cladochytrium replicatum]
MADKKEVLMEEIQKELALQNFQDLLMKVNSKCFAKCVPKPGLKLDNSEQTCLTRCTDLYIQTWNVVSDAYLRRLKKMGGA